MRTGWLRRVRPSELWVIPTHPGQVPPPAHYAPRDGISGGPRGTVSQRPCGVMPAWPFVFYCLTAKIGTLGERPLLARSSRSRKQHIVVDQFGIWPGEGRSTTPRTCASSQHARRKTRIYACDFPSYNGTKGKHHVQTYKTACKDAPTTQAADASKGS